MFYLNVVDVCKLNLCIKFFLNFLYNFELIVSLFGLTYYREQGKVPVVCMVHLQEKNHHLRQILGMVKTLHFQQG